MASMIYQEDVIKALKSTLNLPDGLDFHSLDTEAKKQLMDTYIKTVVPLSVASTRQQGSVNGLTALTNQGSHIFIRVSIVCV